MRSRARPEPGPTHSVKDLLARVVPGLTRVTEQVNRQNYWLEWLSQHLPAEIHARISGVSEQRGILVVFAESAAWSARLRYAASTRFRRTVAPFPRAKRVGFARCAVPSVCGDFRGHQLRFRRPKA